MTNSQRDRAQARARGDSELADAFAAMGVTPAEASLFHVVQYGITVHPSKLPRWAAAADYRLGGPSTRESCAVALSDSLKKGSLQVIDESKLDRIKDDLRDKKILGPIYGLPELGAVDFTPSGAELWRRICSSCFRHADRKPFAYTDVVHVKTARYYRTRFAAMADIARRRDEDGVASMSSPSFIGPWRAQWWRRFAEGWRVDVDERSQWEGHACGLDESSYLDRSLKKAEVQRLRDLLDRHNVSLEEWVVLASLEGGPISPMEDGPSGREGARFAFHLNRFAVRAFKVTITQEASCRALETCLRYGWLRVLDRAAVDEVNSLLRSNPALLALPGTAELRLNGGTYARDEEGLPISAGYLWGAIDFSPAGAALYRMISAEWLGPDWEDKLSVSNAYYCEEHRYCESDEGFEFIVREHMAAGGRVRDRRIVPTGPWCVYWWEPFPSGYRLELELEKDRQLLHA